MKAIACKKYGGPENLEMVDVARPKAGPGELVIRVYAAGVTQADVMMRKGEPHFARLFLGLRGPKNPLIGTIMAGKVEQIGAGVTRFAVGDDIFGETGIAFGALAEFVALPETAALETIPHNMSYEEAAPICDGALTVYNFLTNLVTIRPGMRVLINGASGGLGTSAVQLAKHLGAEVTGVASGTNLDVVKAMGADFVIDYRSADFTRSGKTYDVIFDTPGKSSFSKAKRVLAANGTYLSPVLTIGLLVNMLWTSKFGRQKAKFSATGLLPHDQLRPALAKIKTLIEAGKLWTVMDRSFSMAQVSEAHAFVERGGKRGNVVLSIDHPQVALLAAE